MAPRHDRLDALEARTRRFAVDVIGICRQLQGAPVSLVPIRQLVKAATSVSVNHRAVRRARSWKEFAAKLQIVNEEIDESVQWLEMIQETGLAEHENERAQLGRLLQEGHELRAIFATARKTTRRRQSENAN